MQWPLHASCRDVSACNDLFMPPCRDFPACNGFSMPPCRDFPACNGLSTPLCRDFPACNDFSMPPCRDFPACNGLSTFPCRNFPATCLTSVAFLNHRGRFHNSFTPLSFSIKPEPCGGSCPVLLVGDGSWLSPGISHTIFDLLVVSFVNKLCFSQHGTSAGQGLTLRAPPPLFH